VYSYVDKAFFVGENNRKYFSAHGLKKDQLVYAPHAIDNQRYSDNFGHCYQEKAFQWRHELGYNEKDIVILFVGKLEHKKNPHILIDAVVRINKLFGRPIHLLFVGNGPVEEELKRRASFETVIKFLPFQNQSLMPIVYRLGNIFCLPSRGPGETWGLAVNEALASGLPVVVSDKAGCSFDLVKNGINGYIFSSENVKNLVFSLTKVLNWNPLGVTQRCQNSIERFNYEHFKSALEHHI